MNLVKEIKTVVALQARSINEATRFIDGSFRRAIFLMRECRGKIVVTGIGKSGLIAQKMASTLASTGSPAIFLHPGEAMHGSLGAIGKSDVVFAIGKSGESEELLSILPSIKRIGARIICLTANRNSSLARHSDVILAVPITREVCPLNLAPTTSTTVALVLGDAIAIALMKLRGFDAESFALFHPGGILGRRLLLKVSDVMRGGRRNPVVRIDDSMKHVLIEISRKWTGAANVVDRQGRLAGIVTDFDVRRALMRSRDVLSLSIRDIMNADPTCISADDLAVKALELMESRKKPLTVLPVVDRRRKAVGMVHLHDLVSAGLVPETRRDR